MKIEFNNPVSNSTIFKDVKNPLYNIYQNDYKKEQLQCNNVKYIAKQIKLK